MIKIKLKSVTVTSEFTSDEMKEQLVNLKFIADLSIGIIGGLGIFLLGMKLMSDGMQAIAGKRLRRMIQMVTDNRFLACGVGTAVTGIIQSSSVTTVMLVGMVNAGLMSLEQSVGVIMGADIGTTVTAWIVALRITDYGLLMLGISIFFYLFSKNERIQYTSMMIVGLGMVFFGLEIMKEAMLPIRDMPEFLSLFSRFKPENYWGVLKCVFAGAFITAIVQSSSATVGITITLGSTGIITFETAVALVLGENIGTTITAYLASIGASRAAKRTAFSHIFIKIFGVLFMFPVFFQYIQLLNFILPESLLIDARIAFSHSLFNIIIVCVFLILLKPLVRFIYLLLPEQLKNQETPHLTFLDIGFYDTPALAVQQSFEEIIRMSQASQEMMSDLRSTLVNLNDNRKIKKKIIQTEKNFDLILKEIIAFINKLIAGNISQDVATEARIHLRVADEYEAISDDIATILKLNIKLKKNKLKLTKFGRREILDLHDSVTTFIKFIEQAINDKNTGIFKSAIRETKTINTKIKNFRNNYLNRLTFREMKPEISQTYMDWLNLYRRISDHALNIAEALAGRK